jgi:xanthine dehydrogenase YagS FAD-binding subunit
VPKLIRIEHFNASTIAETVSLLGKDAGKSKIIAGGTDLVAMIKNRLIAPEVVVNMKTIPGLAQIKDDAEGLKIGALTKIIDIETSPIVRSKYPMLAEAAYSVASPQIRNMGTIGGNLCQDVRCWYYRMPPVTGTTFFCYRKGGKTCPSVIGDNRNEAIIGGKRCFAICPSDMAPVLVALDARLKIVGAEGERVVPIAEFYIIMGNILKPDEIITEIQVPTPEPGTRQRFIKFRIRKTIDFALSSVAAVITVKGGVISRSRIVLGGVAPIPYRTTEAEDVLQGKRITETLAETAAKAALSKAKPLSMNRYKVPLTEALVKRAIAS